MPKHETLNTDHFLNRLALDKMINPASIDPVKILKEIFNFSDQENMQDMFMSLCQAALADTYSWEKGSPGNLLYFSEKLEQVVEACYLIHAGQKTAPVTKKEKLPENTRSSKQSAKKKVSEPLDVVEEFFSINPLPEWKLALHNWMEAALSNYSVTESVNSPEILTFYQQIGKLIDAAYLIGKQTRKNK